MLFRSFAKVNLFLRVGPRRPDGYHPLVSWFSSVGLHDVLDIAADASGQLSMTCDHPDVPCDLRNLVLKAAGLLRSHSGTSRGARLHLQKHIPMGGGLGGGSSNGAVALRALSELWKCAMSATDLDKLAGELGSDVPFFLHLPSAICRGRGEIITPVPPPRPKGILLILPAIEMPTPQVYRKFDEMLLGTDLDAVERDLPEGGLNAASLLARLVNDLETPAFAISPELARLRDQCQRELQRPVRMSGSGSTLFTLFDHVHDAQQAATMVQQQLRTRAMGCELAVVDN